MHTIIPEPSKNILYIRTQEACLMPSPRFQEVLQSESRSTESDRVTIGPSLIHRTNDSLEGLPTPS